MTANPEIEKGERRLELLGLAVILVIGLLLRLRQIHTLLPWFIFEDELRLTEVTLHLIQDRTIDPAHSFYPGLPFYLNAVFYLLWSALGHLGEIFREGPQVILAAFNGRAPADPQIVMLSRWLALAFGMAAIVFVHLLCREFLPRRWALFATLLFALSPVAVSMSAVAKTDSQNLFFFVAGYYFAERYFRRGGRGYLLLAASCAGLSLVTKNNYLLCVIFVLCLVWRGLQLRPQWSQLARSRDLWLGVAVMAAAAFVGSPYTFLRFGQTLSTAGWLYRQAEIISFYHTDTAVWWRDRYFYLLSVVLPFVFGLPLFWLMVGGAVHHARKHALSDPLVLCNLVGFIYIFASNSGGPQGGAFAYYLFLHITPLGILVAVEWLKDLSASRRRPARVAGFLAAGIVLVWGLFGVNAFYDFFYRGYDQLGPWMQNHLPPAGRTLFLSVHRPGPVLGPNVTQVWPQDFNRKLIIAQDPDYIIIDTWALAGFRKFYRDLPVAPFADSLMSGGRGYVPFARFPVNYFSERYYAALDPEHDVEIVVLKRTTLPPGREQGN